MSIDALSGKVYAVITGASRGIGAEIALQFSRILGNGSRILLLARDVDKLKKIAGKIPERLTTDCVSVDLSIATKDVLDEILRKSLGPDGPKNFHRAVIVHNVASVGNVTKSTIAMDDYDEWRRYYDLNVFAPAVLNSVFMKIFTDESQVRRLVINVTSLCAIKPMKSTAFYNSGKAAREMYFRTFAAEFPQVNVLNWSPGPVDTDMTDILVSECGDPGIRMQFQELREKKSILTTKQSTERLIEVLKYKKYESGDHVDYYDNSE